MRIEQNSSKIIKRLKDEGWVLKAVKGSHHHFVKGGRKVTVPHPRKDLPKGTARGIAVFVGWV